MNAPFRVFVCALVGVAVFVGGCRDASQPLSPHALEPSRPAALNPDALGTEEAQLRELTRDVALALNDQGIRERLRIDLRSSRFTREHKLPFSSYLHGTSGGILLAKMAKESGCTRDHLLALLAAVRPLEFYMPVEAHRATWRSTADLLVVAALEDEGDPSVAYDLDGHPVLMDGRTAPVRPVLALVPIETDFSSQLDASHYTNRDDHGGQTVGTLVAEDQGGSGGDGTGGAGSYYPPGLYMSSNHLNDVGEPWYKGAPELEVHVHGPTGGDATYGANLSCAGEHATEAPRYYDQNEHDYSAAYGSPGVLLFTKPEIDALNAAYPTGFNVMVWEDDDTACELKTDKDLTGALKLTRDLAGTTAIAVIWAPSVIVTAAGFIADIWQNASWLKSNDDFLGDVVRPSSSGPHTLYIGQSTNGTVSLTTYGM